MSRKQKCKLLKSILLAASLGACTMGPQVTDEIAATDMVLPPGTVLPPIASNATLQAQLEEHDHVDGLVKRMTGFSDGAMVHYWDFGPAPDFVAPVFILGSKDDSGMFVRNGHPGILGVIPGDPGYAPFWSMWLVEVTDQYDGEIIPSVEALAAAQEMGLVKPPMVAPMQVNCPVVSADVRVEVGGDMEPAAPQHNCIYKGHMVSYFSVRAAGGSMMSPLLEDGVHVPIRDVYQLRREGGEVLSEAVRQVDMTCDGDTADTNNIFEASLSDSIYTSLVRVVDVTVPDDYVSIDSTENDHEADFRTAEDLFSESGDPRIDNVVRYGSEGELRNMPIQFEPGSL